MARPQTFSKKENEKKKQARRLEKQNRKEERKLSGNTNSFEDMIAYVDENGRLLRHLRKRITKGRDKPREIVISTPDKNLLRSVKGG